MAEVISIKIGTSGREKRRIIVTYVPPKTNTWRLEEHKEMQREVLKCLDSMVGKNSKILLVGDFNCKNVRWEEMEVNGNAGPWSEEMLQLAMVNTMDQWVEECTRYQGGGGTIYARPGVHKKAGAPSNHKILKPNGKK